MILVQCKTFVHGNVYYPTLFNFINYYGKEGQTMYMVILT